MNEKREEIKGTGEQQAYMLRMWQAGDVWQASLQEVKTGRRIGFSNLESLFTFLMDAAEKHGRPADADMPANLMAHRRNDAKGIEDRRHCCAGHGCSNRHCRRRNVHHQ